MCKIPKSLTVSFCIEYVGTAGTVDTSKSRIHPSLWPQHLGNII